MGALWSQISEKLLALFREKELELAVRHGRARAHSLRCAGG
jgi:hypothetical protein